MNIPEHIITCLAEEGVEVSLELSKVAHKANRFGCEDRNVLNPTGPTNAERLVAELNDLLAVADMLAENGVIPHTWRDPAAQIAKREKVLKFMRYAEGTGALVC
jgi:hypothetical protein